MLIYALSVIGGGRVWELSRRGRRAGGIRGQPAGIAAGRHVCEKGPQDWCNAKLMLAR